jgi:ATPase subunit of ABC transporter with duplicated ATPase domains
MHYKKLKCFFLYSQEYTANNPVFIMPSVVNLAAEQDAKWNTNYNNWVNTRAELAAKLAGANATDAAAAKAAAEAAAIATFSKQCEQSATNPAAHGFFIYSAKRDARRAAELATIAAAATTFATNQAEKLAAHDANYANYAAAKSAFEMARILHAKYGAGIPYTACLINLANAEAAYTRALVTN